MPRIIPYPPALVLLALLLALLAGADSAAAEIVKLPVTIDYPLLQNLIINKAFREGNESVVLANEGDGCIHLALSHPRISEEKGFIRMETEITAHAGTPLGSECMMPVAWKGYLVLYQRPVIDNRTWQLSFKSYRSGLFDSNRQPVKIAGLLWQLIESHVFAYLDSITIDLAPPVNSLKEFLFPLFPPQVQQQTQAMLDSLRTGEPGITPKAVTIEILADVRETYKPDDTRLTETLSGKELEEVVAVWENWDALLSFMIATMAKDVLSPEERQTLMDVLLETRYAFLDSLGNQAVTHDFVRIQFASAWRQLEPIFRNHLTPDASQQKLGYLAFFTAADALTVLDGLGPTFGIEVSRNGLIRLARMLSSDPNILRYGPGVNPNLQHLFEVDPEPVQAPEQPDPPPDSEFLEEDLPPSPPPEPLSQIMNFFCAPLQAAETVSAEEVRRWKVPNGRLDIYVKKVVQLLKAQAQTTAREKKVPPSFRSYYRLMIPAMAWQESCFRQYVVRDNKLTYLLSYNNSSVGLMQVNTRVWRGVYNLERLRWDIRYNAAAGCEIATLYLKDYALRERKGEKKPDNETIVQLVYAMYNGGPAQYKKYLERKRTGRLYSSDKLFQEKYEWVSAADWSKINKCLIGG